MPTNPAKEVAFKTRRRCEIYGKPAIGLNLVAEVKLKSKGYLARGPPAHPKRLLHLLASRDKRRAFSATHRMPRVQRHASSATRQMPRLKHHASSTMRQSAKRHASIKDFDTTSHASLIQYHTSDFGL